MNFICVLLLLLTFINNLLIFLFQIEYYPLSFFLPKKHQNLLLFSLFFIKIPLSQFMIFIAVLIKPNWTDPEIIILIFSANS